MKDHKKLIDYLPPFLAEYREYKRLMSTIQDEEDGIVQNVDDALNDTFIELATEKGIERWENMLSIIPSPTATLEERRAAIKFKLNITLPYTLKALRKMLDDLLGPDQYYMAMTDVYELTVLIELSSAYMQETVASMLRKVVPANIGPNIQLRYVQHLTYNDISRHREMSRYDHEYLRTVGIVEPLEGHIITYYTEFGTPPDNIEFDDTYVLTEDDLPELTYKE